MAIDMTTVKKIMHGNKEVLKIEDSHGILWQKSTTTAYRKLRTIGWWCTSTAAADKYKGWQIPLDFSFPEAYGDNIMFMGQWYKNQIRYSPVISNYSNSKTVTNFILNVNQGGNNCPYICYSDGNHNKAFTETALSNAIWNSNISTEQTSAIWTALSGTTQYVRKRNSNASNSYTCDTDIATLGSYGQGTLSYPLATNPPKPAVYNSYLFVSPSLADSNTDRHWRGKFLRLDITDSSGNYKHRLYPAQRKSDSRIGVYDTITNKFYPETNNCNYNNYNLQIGDVVEENPTGWL